MRLCFPLALVTTRRCQRYTLGACALCAGSIAIKVSSRRSRRRSSSRWLSKMLPLALISLTQRPFSQKASNQLRAAVCPKLSPRLQTKKVAPFWWLSMHTGVAGCCSVLQCVAVCCSALQCVAVLTKKTAPFWVSFDARRCGGE